MKKKQLIAFLTTILLSMPLPAEVLAEEPPAEPEVLAETADPTPDILLTEAAEPASVALFAEESVPAAAELMSEEVQEAPRIDNITLTLPQNKIKIPVSGTNTLQPSVEILDQYGDPLEPTTLTWYLCEDLDNFKEENYTELNGVTIDPENGLITVSTDAVDASIYVGVHAYYEYIDENGKDRTSSGYKHKMLHIGAGGQIEEEEQEPYLANAAIHMPYEKIEIPAEGKTTMEADYSVKDQNGNTYEGEYTVTWSICEKINGEDLTALNGISIDPETGVITVPSDATNCTVYVHLYVRAESGRYSNDFQPLKIGTGGVIAGDPFLSSVEITLDNDVLQIPVAGEDAVTVQPAFSAFDQNKDPYEADFSVTWALRETDSEENLSELNGVTIDTKTGLITISDTAQEGSFTVYLYVQEGTEEQFFYAYYSMELTLEYAAETEYPVNTFNSDISGTCIVSGANSLRTVLTLNNAADTPATVTVLLVEYDANQKMTDCTFEQLAIEGNADAELSYHADNKDIDVLRIFVMNDTQQPLTQKTEIFAD